METVTIGCRLPNGYVLEVGYSVVAAASDGRSMTQVTRGSNYARHVLRGTHMHTAELRRAKIQTPAVLAPEPFINRNVPKALWDEWMKTHSKDWVIRSGNIFEVKDAKNAANVQAAVMDSMASPAVLAPLDPSKPLVFGKDLNGDDIVIDKADFTKA